MPLLRDKIYLDILRVVAIFFVVFNHTSGFYFMPVSQSGTVEYWWLLLQNQVVKMAVPMFLMVTGALLLPKDETIYDVLRKRVLRFLVVFLFVVVVQYVFHAAWMGFELRLSHIYFIMFHGNMGLCYSFYTHWFFYAYLGILIMLPFLRMIAKAMTTQLALYILGMQVVLCCVLPLLELIMGKYLGCSTFAYWLPFHPETDMLPYSSGYCVFYVLMGFFVEHRISLDLWRRYRVWGIALAVVCFVAGGAGMEFARSCTGCMKIDQSIVFLTAFLPIPCVVAYLSLKSACADVSFKPMTRKIVAALGGAVFTVMLFENLFRIMLQQNRYVWLPDVGKLPAAILITSIIYILTMLLGLTLKRIPILKRIL